MKAKTVFALLTILMVPVGVALMVWGFTQMNESEYVLTNMHHGFAFSIVWISIGVCIFWQWSVWFFSHLISFNHEYRIEHIIFNVGILFLSTCFIVSGIYIIEQNPLYLNICDCPPGYFGVNCTLCPTNGSICSGHGECDDTVFGRGTCFCDPGYAGDTCQHCNLHYTRDSDNQCVCEHIWEDSQCTVPKPPFDVTHYPFVHCNTGWVQTGVKQLTPHAFWSRPSSWPVCGQCDRHYSGNPDVMCTPCLGMVNGSVCNGHGTCWDNHNYEKHVWDCTGPDCASNVPDGGLRTVCTSTSTTCSADSDCKNSYHCGGTCRSLFKRPSFSWTNNFNGQTCKTNADCNFGSNYFSQFLPPGWDTEGECTEKTCCAEQRYGNSTCFGCTNDRGEITVSRIAPACDLCPGSDMKSMVCNGHGTCVPSFGSDGSYDTAKCSCNAKDSKVWRGQYCECLASNIFSTQCDSCAQGFYLPPDINKSTDEAIPAETSCQSCPGSTNGAGTLACSWNKGLGNCVYNDAVGTRIDGESSEDFSKRLLNVGKCSCANQLVDAPVIAAAGEQCSQAPPNFYKRYNDGDWSMQSCPRTLPLGLNTCPSQYKWDYIASNGESRQACTQSCGGKPVDVAMCMDELSQQPGYLNETFSGNWEFLIDTNKTEDLGTCFCNKNDINGVHYYKGVNGLCVKSKSAI